MILSHLNNSQTIFITLGGISLQVQPQCIIVNIEAGQLTDTNTNQGYIIQFPGILQEIYCRYVLFEFHLKFWNTGNICIPVR